jgi:hypothetical protein
MGYTTEFSGLGFWTDKPLKAEHIAYINSFADTRHMLYDMTQIRPGPTRAAVDVPDEAAFVLEEDKLETEAVSRDPSGRPSIYRLSSIDVNKTPPGVPSLWCQWRVNEDGNIHWDGGEKFYCYDEWLVWLIEMLLKPWGYVLNGTVDYQGEDGDDYGRIIVAHNEVTNVFQWKGGE